MIWWNKEEKREYQFNSRVLWWQHKTPHKPQPWERKLVLIHSLVTFPVLHYFSLSLEHSSFKVLLSLHKETKLDKVGELKIAPRGQKIEIKSLCSDPLGIKFKIKSSNNSFVNRSSHVSLTCKLNLPFPRTFQFCTENKERKNWNLLHRHASPPSFPNQDRRTPQ